jgi:hypothetical protein
MTAGVVLNGIVNVAVLLVRWFLTEGTVGLEMSKSSTELTTVHTGTIEDSMSDLNAYVAAIIGALNIRVIRAETDRTRRSRVGSGRR